MKNTSLNWYNKVKEAFEDRGLVDSLSDPCVFISKDMIILVYFDDIIFISKEYFTIKKFIYSMKDTPESFEFTEEGAVNVYLGVDISPLPDRKGFKLYQPLLIDILSKLWVFIQRPQKVLQKIPHMGIHF